MAWIQRFGIGGNFRHWATGMAFGLGLVSLAAHPSSICRWVDGNGRTQLSDVVPDQYKLLAICSDSQKYELKPVQKSDTDRQKPRQETTARHEIAGPPALAASSPFGASPVGVLPGAKRPTAVITEDMDCATRWHIYDESVECFRPYRTTRGATKPEAFDHCNDILSPEIRCGPPSN
jgi:hypothetical protein